MTVTYAIITAHGIGVSTRDSCYGAQCRPTATQSEARRQTTATPPICAVRE
jgi:hypothetical protein